MVWASRSITGCTHTADLPFLALRSNQERTITTDWYPTYHLPVKITEPGRETTFIYDGNGNLLAKSIVDTTAP